MSKSLNLFVSAGEASGDLHGAEVIHFLRYCAPEDMNLQIWGMGSKKLAEAEVEIIHDSSELGIIGVADVVKKLPTLFQLESKLIAEIKARKPDVALFVDYPGLNLRLAAAIKKHLPFCKVVFYVAPQVWAWNKARIKKLPGLVDRLLTILPFEEELHREAGTSARFVGNPSSWWMDNLELPEREEILQAAELNPEKPVIGIFPGSRNREIDFMLPVFLQAAKQLHEKKPDIQFVMVRARTITSEKLKAHFEALEVPEKLIKIEEPDNNYAILRSVDIAWLTSGTVTLEAACGGTPLILGYRENPIFFKGYLFLRLTDKIGLPNIVAQDFVCPELLQEDCTPEKWVEITESWLDTPGKLAEIKNTLLQRVANPLKASVNPAYNVAQEILTIHQINHLSRENQIHMREQAHQNSQQTMKELGDRKSRYIQL